MIIVQLPAKPSPIPVTLGSWTPAFVVQEYFNGDAHWEAIKKKPKTEREEERIVPSM